MVSCDITDKFFRYKPIFHSTIHNNLLFALHQEDDILELTHSQPMINNTALDECLLFVLITKSISFGSLR